MTKSTARVDSTWLATRTGQGDRCEYHSYPAAFCTAHRTKPITLCSIYFRSCYVVGGRRKSCNASVTPRKQQPVRETKQRAEGPRDHATPVTSKSSKHLHNEAILQPVFWRLYRLYSTVERHARCAFDKKVVGTISVCFCLLWLVWLILLVRCPGFVLRPSFLALGGERNDWNMYLTDGGSDYNDPDTEDITYDSTVSSPGFYW